MVRTVGGMGMVGRGWTRIRHIACFTTLIAVGVVLLVGAAPVAADSTGISVGVAPGGSAAATEGGGLATFRVTRLGADPLTDVSVTASIASGVADVGTPSPASFTLSAANPFQDVTVSAVDDAGDEPGESFNLRLNASVGSNVDASGTVVDNDVVLRLVDGSITEGAAASSSTVALTIDQPSSLPIDVRILTTDGTAKVGSDYFPPNPRIIDAGQTQINVPVQVVDDNVSEDPETFGLTIDQVFVGGGQVVHLARAAGTATIADNDSAPGGGTSPNPPAPPATNPPSAPATTPLPAASPQSPSSTPKVRRPFQARVLWTRPAGKVKGRQRAAIRVTLNQKIVCRLVMTQGKTTVRSGQFELRAGNRTFYVLLPQSVTKGQVDFEIHVTSATGQKVLKTKLVLTA